MKFITIASAALCLSATGLAAPFTHIRQERNRARAAGRRGNPMNRALAPESSNNTHVSYSTNWSGAVLVGTGYKSVTAQFVAPTPTSAGSGSAWVGIDGDTCQTAILQTGIDWTYNSGYDAWYEWYPDYAYDFSGITIHAGDSILTTVTATSKTAGKATIENLTTGVTVSHSFSNEASEGSLCEYNAEWIVEDYESGNSQVKFANFGSVTFTGASASGSAGTVGTTGAEIIDMETSSGSVIVQCSVPSSSSVKCTYV